MLRINQYKKYGCHCLIGLFCATVLIYCKHVVNTEYKRTGVNEMVKENLTQLQNRYFYSTRAYELLNEKNLSALENACHNRLTWLDTSAGRSSLPWFTFKVESYKRWQRHTSPFNMEFVINNVDICSNQNRLILIYVFSAAKNFKARKLIRSTWGGVKTYRGFSIRTVYLLGRRSDVQQSQILQENQQYNDIIQGDFVDSYGNVTYKSYLGLKWVVNFCSSAKWYIKVDDDVFMNIYNFAGRLLERKLLVVPGFLCHLLLNIDVERSSNDNGWLIRREQYAESIYPPFCNGPYYIYPAILALPLYACYSQMEFFKIEDVFTTGIVRHILNIPISHFYDAKALTDKELTAPVDDIHLFHGSKIQYFQNYNSTLLADGSIVFKYLWRNISNSYL